MKNASNKTLSSVKREGKVPFSSGGEWAGGRTSLGYCIASGFEMGGPFLFLETNVQ